MGPTYCFSAIFTGEKHPCIDFKKQRPKIDICVEPAKSFEGVCCGILDITHPKDMDRLCASLLVLRQVMVLLSLLYDVNRHYNYRFSAAPSM